MSWVESGALIRKSLKMCTVGVPPGTVLGNTGLNDSQFAWQFAEFHARLISDAVVDVSL